MFSVLVTNSLHYGVPPFTCYPQQHIPSYWRTHPSPRTANTAPFRTATPFMP